MLYLLFTCHFLGDFTHLSMPFMLRAKTKGAPLMPIFLHSLVHAGLMFIVLLFFKDVQEVIQGAGIVLVTHLLIDVLKGRLNVWFLALKDSTRPLHWYVFGLDQLLHSFVILYM